MASVCALALTAGFVMPAAAQSQDVQLGSSAGVQSGFEVASSSTDSASSGSFEIATTAVAVSAPTPSGRSTDGAALTYGADFSMWNTAKPTVAVVAVSHAQPVTHIAVVPTRAQTHDNTPAINRLASGLFARTRELASRITSSAMHFIGTPYVFGGTSTYGFDCSGYVQHVFAMFGISLPRTADAQYLVGTHVAQRQMVRGDLVFFQTYTAGVSHVGIYLGHDSFIHSSSHGVQVSSLHENYWASRYVGATHIIGASLVGSHVVN